MEVLGVENLGTPIVQPLGASHRLAFRATAITTTVIRDALVTAAVALFDVATERCRPADLDRCHCPALGRRPLPPCCPKSVTVVAEHIHYFRPDRAIARTAQAAVGALDRAATGISGSGSSGLVVAHTLLVAIRR